MAACAQLAARSRPLARPNPGVGALIVSKGRVLARGWTMQGGRPHAEAQALQQFSQVSEAQRDEATLYVTLEPCAHRSHRGPACADLVAQSGLTRVVIGQHDPDPRTKGQGIERLEESGISTRVLEDEASARSLAGYLTRRRLGRPYVTCKLALSLDGCIALGDGSSQWITGEDARAHCHAMRAKNDAILVGGGTWRADRPRLDVRLKGLENRQPERFVLTRGVKPDNASIINAPGDITKLEGIDTLYLEGGAKAAASFLAADLVDELHLYRAPILIGGGLPSLADIALSNLDDAHGRWREDKSAMLGKDRFTAYLRTRQIAA